VNDSRERKTPSGCLHALVEQGNTVVVIEHNLDVIKTADWVLDLGPGGGVNGGEIVAEGTPEQVAKEPRSYTGHYLAELLAKARTSFSSAHLERSSSAAENEVERPRKRRASTRETQPAE